MLKFQKFLEAKKTQLLKNQKGFSMMEIVVFIVVVAVFLAVAVPEVKNIISNARVASCESDIKTVGDAVVQYYTEIGDFPEADDIDALKTELTTKKTINNHEYGPWLKKNFQVNDPWGHPYKIERSSDEYDIVSQGPNNDSDSEIRYSTLGNRDEK